MSVTSKRRARRAVDWQEVRRRLWTADTVRVDPVRERALLDQRARALARTPDVERGEADLLELVSFTLTGERYALASSCVMQVIKLQDLVRLPGAPEHLLGLTNLRGEILPVFDLRALLGLSRGQLTDLSRLLVLGTGDAELGILADAVLEIERRDASELRSAGDAFAHADLPYLRGVTADALIVLDGRELLQDPRLFLSNAEPSAPSPGE